MKRMLIASAASIALISSPAFAAPNDSQSFDINASVQQECSLADPSNVNLGAQSIDEAPGAGALLINANDSDSQSVWASCNTPATVTLTSLNDGLLNSAGLGGADPAEFTDQIEYRVTFDSDVNDVTLATTDAGNSNSVSQTSAFHDQAEIIINVLTGDNPLRPVAGTYTDTVTVALAAI